MYTKRGPTRVDDRCRGQPGAGETSLCHKALWKALGTGPRAGEGGAREAVSQAGTETPGATVALAKHAALLEGSRPLGRAWAGQGVASQGDPKAPVGALIREATVAVSAATPGIADLRGTRIVANGWVCL